MYYGVSFYIFYTNMHMNMVHNNKVNINLLIIH